MVLWSTLCAPIFRDTHMAIGQCTIYETDKKPISYIWPFLAIAMAPTKLYDGFYKISQTRLLESSFTTMGNARRCFHQIWVLQEPHR